MSKMFPDEPNSQANYSFSKVFFSFVVRFVVVQFEIKINLKCLKKGIINFENHVGTSSPLYIITI